MIFNMIGGGNGGNAGLNFKVVGGITEPTSPKENTIWVNTGVEITNWVFSVDEPETLSEDMVWFPIGTSNTAFNALKKNGIMVYPMSAKQYVNGAWVNKTAKSYQNGTWVDWVVYLYQNGNTFDGLTGGFYVNGVFTLNEDHIYFSLRANNGIVRTEKPIDFTNISELHCILEGIESNSTDGKQLNLCVWNNKPTSYTDGQVAASATYKQLSVTDGTYEMVLDVSGITGEKYVGLSGASNGTGAKMSGRIVGMRGEP